MLSPNPLSPEPVSIFPGRLGIQQRVLPAYRGPFFDTLAQVCSGGLGVFAGQPGAGEAIRTADRLNLAQYTQACNLHIGRVDAPYYLCWQQGILKWLQTWQPDVLVLEANPRTIATRLAAAWMHARGQPVLGWGLGVLASVSGDTLEFMRRPGRERFLTQFDGVIAYSEKGAESYRAAGVPGEKVFVAPNAVAPRPQGPPPERSAAYDGQPVALYVGRLQERKRLDLLLRACAALPPDLAPRLVIVGDGPARSILEQMAAECYPSTEFPGSQHGKALQQYFQQADVFVLPGSGGLAVQEAMSHALPVIVAAGDGTQDILIRPETGWQIPPDNLDALTESLQVAFGDIPRLRKMGRAAYDLVAEEVNLEAMTEAFIKAINTISASH